MQTQRQRDDLSRQLVRLDGQRRSDMLRELQDATVALSKIRFRLQSTGDKLQYTVLAKSQLARGLGSQPVITIMRSATNSLEKLAANEDFELQPGDVVEVALMKDTLGTKLSDQEN
jgi:polysaccharide export outer membrane protein